MLAKIKSVKQHLPKPIKNIIRPLYIKVRGKKLKIDEELLQDMVEFHNQTNDFKITYEEGLMLCKLGKKLMADLWDLMNIKNKEDVKKYYEICPYSLFELLYSHSNEGNRRFREKVVRLSSGEVLDYGGGDGALSMKLADKGLNVTYVDVQSVNMEFAKWIFKKRGYNIKVLDAYKDQEKIWQKAYDTILCIEVIEHILNPKEMLERMATNLKENGKIIITRLHCPGPTPEHPFHLKLPSNIEETLKLQGLIKQQGILNGDRDLWIKGSSPLIIGGETVS